MFSKLQRFLASVSLVGVCVTIGACGPIAPVEVPPPTAVIPPLALKVDLPDGQAGVARSEGRLHLFLARTDGAFFEATSNPDHPGTTAIHLMSYGGETGRTSNSFIFGNAPPGASRVVVNPGGANGDVAAGIFLVWLSERDMSPNDLQWEFRDGSGRALSSGAGITP